MPGVWTGLTNQPNFNMSTMMLRTDGVVMVQENDTNHWHAFTPDDSGSYENGVWSQLADMQFTRMYYASGVFKDGRIIVSGGEYSNAGNDTNNTQIYDPGNNNWVDVIPPVGWANIGDASSCILPDGRLMIGSMATPQCTIYNPENGFWIPAANKAVRPNEETWILLPDNTIITAQCFAPYESEKYNIAQNTWQNEGIIPVSLVNHNTAEIGPAMLMPNGKVIYFGADGSSGTGKTAIYTPPANPLNKGVWEAGPDIPSLDNKILVCSDNPATLLPNGKVLFIAAEYFPKDWGNVIYFLEYDPSSNTIAQAPTPPNNLAPVYTSRLILLPTGQVLFGPSSNNLQIYTPDGAPQDSWKPTILTITPSAVNSYLLTGTQLNGLSQANIYGDDCSSATNYPIITITNSAGTKYYCKSNNFSTMGVATGNAVVSCNFSTSAPNGAYQLNVIANGISSASQPFYVGPYEKRIFEAGTTFAPETDGTWLMADFDHDGIPDLVFIKTGLSCMEVHVASGSSNYQTRIFEAGTTFAPETDGTWLMADFDHDGIPDLVFIKTGLSCMEVHVASGCSNYQTRIFEAGTTFAPETDGTWLMADFDHDGIPDLVFIKTGLSCMEVHVASGSSNYQTRIFEAGTTFAPETDGTWLMTDFDHDGIPDLVFIKTGLSCMEVHVASGCSNYQTRIFEAGTTFAPETDGTWLMTDFQNNKTNDLVFIKTGLSCMEVHVAAENATT